MCRRRLVFYRLHLTGQCNSNIHCSKYINFSISFTTYVYANDDDDDDDDDDDNYIHKNNDIINIYVKT